MALGADETVHMRYGCDGQTLAVAVADPFGSLSKRAVTDRLRKVRDGIPKPNAGVAGAGLGPGDDLLRRQSAHLQPSRRDG